jgi:hypothetical protein
MEFHRTSPKISTELHKTSMEFHETSKEIKRTLMIFMELHRNLMEPLDPIFREEFLWS